MRTATDYVGSYGPTWRTGVLSEHLSAFTAAGGGLRAAASGSGLLWAVPAARAAVVPVVCSEIVEIPTEDGPVSGRCGADATADGMCPAHAEQMAGWRAMSEAERLSWEKEHC